MCLYSRGFLLEVTEMFSAGEVVVYSTQGVCLVKEITTMKFGGTKAEYYVLTPVSDRGGGCLRADGEACACCENAPRSEP